MIRVFIADDHSIVREGLKQILTDTFDLRVAGEADSGPEALRKIQKNNFDVVVLDLSLPGLSGLDVLKQLKIDKPDLPVLILSIHPEEQYAVRVLKAGASGYLSKETAPEELVGAIRKISSGGRYVSTSLAEKLAFDLGMNTEKALHESLSDREFQVLCMIASGKRGIDIADELHLSEKTVSTYRTRILEKMNMKSNAELTHYAIKNGLVG
jgi:two-component system invasion response regulator UvrY